MITSLFQDYYQTLLTKQDYRTAFAVLRKNPDILGLNHENAEEIRTHLNQTYTKFAEYIPGDELTDGLTDILRQITGEPKLEFVLK